MEILIFCHLVKSRSKKKEKSFLEAIEIVGVKLFNIPPRIRVMKLRIFPVMERIRNIRDFKKRIETAWDD